MKTGTENVGIVIVARDRLSMFRPCLEAVYKYTAPPFQVTVVAGKADDATRNFLLEQTEKNNLKVIFNERLLLQGEARNIGLRETGERYCIILENDTIVRRNWLPPLIECAKEENAAVVTPLIYWYRGLHAAGCKFEELEVNGKAYLKNKIIYTEIRRRKIDYPETHCILIDRQKFSGKFDDAEPFDVDFGLALRKENLQVFLEPRSVVTYDAPPALKVSDIDTYIFRWNPASWKDRHIRFMKKWNVNYDPVHKLASYRRQQIKLGLAAKFPNKVTVGLANLGIKFINYLQSKVPNIYGYKE